MSLEGIGRNAIARLLQQQGLHVSEGSVGNIIREYRRQESLDIKSSEPEVQQSHPTQQKQINTSNNTYTDDNIIDSTSSQSSIVTPPLGDGLAGLDKPALNYGAPLQRFLNNEIATAGALGDKDNSTIVGTTIVPDAPAITVVPESTLHPKAPEPEQISINNDTNYLNISHVTKDASLEEEDQEQCKQSEHHQSRNSIKIPVVTSSPRTSKNSETETPTPIDYETVEDSETASTITTPVLTTKKSGIPSTPPSEPKEETSEIDWDSDESWQRRMFDGIRTAKKQRHEELALIDQKYQDLDQKMHELNEERQQLAHLRQNLDREKTELQAKEAKLVEIEPLIPSVKMLQSAGITFNVITTYIAACTEKSVLQNMDMKTAAFEVAQVIRKYHDLESLEKAVITLEQQLKGLQNFSDLKNQALLTIMTLELNGYSEKEIADLAAWNKHQQTSLGNPGQGQGNGSSSTNNNGGVGNGSKWKLDTELNLPRNN